MKNKLLLTTALVGGLALSTQATAADKIKLGVGGFMENWIGFAAQSSSFETGAGTSLEANYNDIDVQQDSEIHITGSGKLDNGITVTATFEIEADRGSTGNDNVFVELASPSVGTLQLGAGADVTDQMHNASPDVGIGNHDGDYANWVVAPDNFTDLAATFFSGGGPNAKVTYLSPTFSGLQIGGTYTPDAVNDTQAIPEVNNTTYSAYSAAAAYSRTVGNVSFVMDVGFGRIDGQGTTAVQESWQGGLNVSIDGITVGGSFMDVNEDNGTTTTSNAGQVYDVGVSYTTGAASVSLTWLHSETKGVIATGGDDKKDSVMLSAAYEMGPGLTARGSLFRVDFNDETTANANNNDGWGVVAGIDLNF